MLISFPLFRRITLKLIISSILITLVSGSLYAQSTCMSRCEKVFGVDDYRCPDICQHHPDGLKKPKRKKAELDATSASKVVESSSSASQVQQTQTPQPQAQQASTAEKKPAQAAAASSAQASKEKQ